ncbi:MAG: glutathione S-transferase N-terminal domain-containing protein [Sphingomonadales bacterium]|nr:glutathione S-transferase N-terminal domain-containing protein [Sphingomonadales bacterium]
MTIRLYHFPTPNALKVTIALEEMALPYTVTTVNILEGEQADPAFRAINPNGRIPALVDGAVTVFESGAILQYLARKSGQFCPADEPGRTEVESWVCWQLAGLGPMAGQVNWFARAAGKPGRDPAETSLALHRFRKEVARLFTVLEARLQGRAWICRDYSIADMACWPWVDKYHEHAGGITRYPAVAQWRARVGARPAVQAALAKASASPGE